MTLLDLLKEKSESKKSIYSGLKRIKTNYDINNVIDKKFSFNEINNIYKLYPDILINSDNRIKEKIINKILLTIAINNNPSYDKNLNNYFERDFDKIKIIFNLCEGKYLDKYFGMVSGLSLVTMKSYADLISFCCDKEDKDLAKKILSWVFEERVESYNISHRNTEEMITKSRKQEEIIRHQLLFASLQFKSFQDVINKWESLKTLSYVHDAPIDYTSVKSGLFWSLEIDKKFPDFTEYLLDSKSYYLLAQSSLKSSLNDNKISLNYPSILLKNLDFNNKEIVTSIVKKFSDNTFMLDDSQLCLSKSDFLNYIYNNKSINRDNFLFFINTFNKLYSEINNFNYDISLYIKAYRESLSLANDVDVLEKGTEIDFFEKKYLNDDFFTEVLKNHKFENKAEKEKFLSEWIRSTNNLDIIKKHEKEFQIDLRKFILKQKIPVNLNILNNDFNMMNLIKSYRKILGNKKDLSFLLDCNKIDIAPLIYIDKILKPLIEDALILDIPFNKVFYKKINLLLESLEEMENKEKIIEKIDSLIIKDEEKIKVLNRIVGENLYPTIEVLKSNIEKRVLQKLFNNDKFSYKRKNRL